MKTRRQQTVVPYWVLQVFLFLFCFCFLHRWSARTRAGSGLPVRCSTKEMTRRQVDQAGYCSISFVRGTSTIISLVRGTSTIGAPVPDRPPEPGGLSVLAIGMATERSAATRRGGRTRPSLALVLLAPRIAIAEDVLKRDEPLLSGQQLPRNPLVGQHPPVLRLCVVGRPAGRVADEVRLVSRRDIVADPQRVRAVHHLFTPTPPEPHPKR